jgi:hypothetical protein
MLRPGASRSNLYLVQAKTMLESLSYLVVQKKKKTRYLLETFEIASRTTFIKLTAAVDDSPYYLSVYSMLLTE